MEHIGINHRDEPSKLICEDCKQLLVHRGIEFFTKNIIVVGFVIEKCNLPIPFRGTDGIYKLLKSKCNILFDVEKEEELEKSIMDKLLDFSDYDLLNDSSKDNCDRQPPKVEIDYKCIMNIFGTPGEFDTQEEYINFIKKVNGECTGLCLSAFNNHKKTTLNELDNIFYMSDAVITNFSLNDRLLVFCTMLISTAKNNSNQQFLKLFKPSKIDMIYIQLEPYNTLDQNYYYLSNDNYGFKMNLLPINIFSHNINLNTGDNLISELLRRFMYNYNCFNMKHFISIFNEHVKGETNNTIELINSNLALRQCVTEKILIAITMVHSATFQKNENIIAEELFVQPYLSMIEKDHSSNETFDLFKYQYTCVKPIKAMSKSIFDIIKKNVDKNTDDTDEK